MCLIIRQSVYGNVTILPHFLPFTKPGHLVHEIRIVCYMIYIINAGSHIKYYIFLVAK